MEEQLSSTNSYVWAIVFAVWVLIVIFGTIKSKKNTIVIFKDFDDLFVSFGIMALPLIFYILAYMSAAFLGIDISLATNYLSPISAILIAIYAFKISLIENKMNIINALISFITKVPLSIIWVFAFFSMLNPSGKTAKDRRAQRGLMVFLLTFLTPFILMLVKEKTGSMFNPKNMISGRRFSGASDIRNKFK
jgi:hypothetical protein